MICKNCYKRFGSRSLGHIESNGSKIIEFESAEEGICPNCKDKEKDKLKPT